MVEQQALTPTGGQETFARLVRRRRRVASFAVWLRAGGEQMVAYHSQVVRDTP